MRSKSVNKKPFFEAVAHHNLERFHSECIVWAFNYNKQMLINFINNFREFSLLEKEDDKKGVFKILEKEDFVILEAFSEVSNIDILIAYSFINEEKMEEYYLIHVENKVKANEHDIVIKPKTKPERIKDFTNFLTEKGTLTAGRPKETLKKNFDELFFKTDEISQSEFYFFRNKDVIVKEVNKRLECLWEVNAELEEAQNGRILFNGSPVYSYKYEMNIKKPFSNIKRIDDSYSDMVIIEHGKSAFDSEEEMIGEVIKNNPIDWKWKYAYLTPSLSFSNKKMEQPIKQNRWVNNKKILTKKINNEWISISYHDIFKAMPNTIEENSTLSSKTNDASFYIFNEYRKFILSEFGEGRNEKIPLDLTSRSGNRFGVNINKSSKLLSSDTLDIILDQDNRSNMLELHAVRQHFEYLKRSIERDIRMTSVNYVNLKGFIINFQTDTGNNGGFLFEVYYKFDIENPNKEIFDLVKAQVVDSNPKMKKIEMRIGVQFEHNKLGEGVYKFYIADYIYETGLIKNTKVAKELYRVAAFNSIKEFFGDTYLIKRKCEKFEVKAKDKQKDFKFNGSTTKSFCSTILYDFKFGSLEELKTIFKDDIKHISNQINAKLPDVQKLFQ